MSVINPAPFVYESILIRNSLVLPAFYMDYYHNIRGDYVTTDTTTRVEIVVYLLISYNNNKT